jgi:hypothetical protein
MKFIGSTKLHRKFGFWGTRLCCSAQDFHVGPVSYPRGSAKPVVNYKESRMSLLYCAEKLGVSGTAAPSARGSEAP